VEFVSARNRVGLAFTTSGRTDWIDGPETVLSVGAAVRVRWLERESEHLESEDLESEDLESE
jgi:hypothetical protein